MTWNPPHFRHAWLAAVWMSVTPLGPGWADGIPDRNVAAPSADSAPVLDLANLSLDELSAIKVETVYSASKHEQPTTQAPSAVSLVTRDEIRKYGHRTLAEILNSVRGFYVSYDRNYGHLGSRGFNRTGDFGGRILLMIDGHRLNDGVYDSAAITTDFPLDVDLIEQVEIIRGPGSSLYGNNAFFGVINVITRRGRDLAGGEVSASYGSFDTWTGRASYGKHFTNGVEFVVSGSLIDSAGQARLTYPEFVAEDLDGGWARNLFTRVSYADFALQGGLSRRQKDWPTATYDTVPNAHDPSLSTDDERAFADFSFRRTFGDDWNVAARTYFDRYEFRGSYPYANDDPTTVAYVNRDLAVATSAGVDLSVDKILAERHRITVGGEWRHDFELVQENWDDHPPAIYLDSRERGDLVGVYAQDEWTLRTNWLAHAGVRYDHYDVFGGTVNPRLALIHRPWQTSTIKLLYGQAFRAPNAYELYYSGYLARANPSLDPETIRSYELVWEQQLGHAWRASASLFYNDVDNLINQELDPGADPDSLDDDLLYFDNVGQASTIGMDWELMVDLPGTLQGRASYTLAHTEDRDTGKTLDNSPEHLGKVNLSLPLWRDRIFASVELQAMSKRLTVIDQESSPYAVVNLTLFSRELVKGLEASASLYNLFDQRYSHPVSDEFNYTGSTSGQPIVLDQVEQDGRGFRIKLTYRF